MPQVGSKATGSGVVRTVEQRIHRKRPVRVAVSIDVTISSPGATLDGETMALDDRVLLYEQTTRAENGIYVWNGATTEMTRAFDFNSDTEVKAGASFTIAEGTHAEKAAQLVTNDPITLETTALEFELRTPAGTPAGGLLNGTFAETFNALATSDGATVTMSLEKTGTGNLTMRFSDGETILDTTPAKTITLTAGSDTAPTENYIYIPQSTKVLTKSTSDWPVGEHIKVAYFLVPSATFVQSDGAYVNQNWNDHAAGADNQGHLPHVAENVRLTANGGHWHSGTSPTVTITPNGGAPDNVQVAISAGVVFQMHRHAVAATDMGSGDKALVVNHNTTPYTAITDLNTQLTDSAGGSMSGRYFNIVVWGVGNKTGEYQPLMVNLPAGSYTVQANAINDVDNFDVFSMPVGFTEESSTGFLISRFTFLHSAAASGTWTLVSTLDLRGQSPNVLSGGAGGAPVVTEFSDNQFKVVDDGDVTKIMQLQVSGVSTATTRTQTVPDASGILAHTSQTNGTIDHTADLANVGSNSHAQIDTHIAATAAHGVTGAVVGTTDTQTLSAKTLTTPTIADFTNAGHDHSNAAGGGSLATAAPAQGIGASNSAGSASTYVKSDHDHTIRESGGQDLTLGAIEDGEVVYRSGNTLAGIDQVFDHACFHGGSAAATTAQQTTRNAHRVIAFDDTTDEYAIFEECMHPLYQGGTITATLQWAAATATTNEVRWLVAFERIAADDLDIDGDSFATARVSLDTAPAAAGQLSYASITFSQAEADSVAAGEAFRLKVTRDADHVDDDLVGDAQLLRVLVQS